MNVLLWVLQIALAFMFFSGGAWKIFQYEQLSKMPVMRSLPRAAWTTVGGLEMLGAILMLVPAAAPALRLVSPLAALALALECLAVTAIYARHSLAVAATNPMVWSATMGALAAAVACARYALLPPA